MHYWERTHFNSQRRFSPAYSQLSSCILQRCVSMGNRVKSRGQERVIDNLKAETGKLELTQLHLCNPELEKEDINVQICKRAPHADKDISIPKNKEKYVFLGYVMEIGTFLICKKQIRFPQTLVHRGVHCECIWAPKVTGELQPGVIPFLSQEDVHSIVLEIEKESNAWSYC